MLLPKNRWAAAVARVAVMAPVERLLLIRVPSPEKEETPPTIGTQVPSPRQKVEEEAEVPELKWEMPRLPVTSALAKSTAERVLVTIPEALTACHRPVAGEAGSK